MIVIPCTPDGQSRWTQRTTLAGRTYALTFDWSQRDGKWSLDLADQDGSLIRAGIPLVTNVPLLRFVRDARRPPGELFVFDTEERAEDPAFDDIGTRFTLAYVEPGEIPT